MTLRRGLSAVLLFTVLISAMRGGSAVAAGKGQPYDWGRFYYYPYVYYPHNFTGPQEFDSLYHRYPAERRIPVYNSNWHNFYPSKHPYHMGNAFILDVF